MVATILMTLLRFNEMSYSLRSIKANRDHAFFCSRQEFSLSHTHTRLTAFFSGTTWVSRYQKGKPIWILLKQETVSCSGISWAIRKSAPRSRQITMPAPHRSVFYRPDALPAAQPTASKHWRRENFHYHCREYKQFKH